MLRSALLISTALLLLAPAAASAEILGATGDRPVDLAMDASGNVYTANKGSNSVTKITPEGSSSLFRALPAGARPATPTAIASDLAGNIYVANSTQNTVTKIRPDGSVPAPWPVPAGSSPEELTVGADGFIYVVSDANPDAITKISPEGEVVKTIDLPPSTYYLGIAGDPQGNLFVTDYAHRTVLKVTPSGTVSNLAPPNTTGAAPWGITIDSDGNVYTANYQGNSVTRITPDGSAKTVTLNFTGVGSGANPRGITIDASGRIYAAAYTGGDVVVLPTGVWGDSGTFVVAPMASGAATTTVIGSRSGKVFATNEFDDNVAKLTYNVFSPGPDLPPSTSAPPRRPAAPGASPGDGKATVTVLSNPVDARFGDPASYLVRVVGDNSKSCTVTPPQTSCEVSGLSNGTSYRFTASARLSTWQTGASDPSEPVVPDSAPAPGTATPPGSGSSAALKAGLSPFKVRTRRGKLYLASRATVSEAGTIIQEARRGGRVVCRAQLTTTRAGQHALSCPFGKSARRYLRTRAMQLVVTTRFTAPGRNPVQAVSRLTVKKRR